MAQTSLLELEYFASAEWFKLFLTSEQVLIEQYEHLVRGTHRSRCVVAGPNGKIILSIPLQRGRNQRTIMKDVKIGYEEPWQQLHVKTLNSCYRRSPYFEFFEDEVIHFFEKKYSYLIELNIASLEWIQKILTTNKEYTLTTNYEKHPENILDYRNEFDSNISKQTISPYMQPFADRNGFVGNVSMLDMIFCLGKKSLEQIML